MENNAAMVEETKSTAPLLATTNVTNDAKTPIEADISKKVQQRAKLEAHLNSACGIGKKRRQLLSAFWGTMWMELERIGWLKIEATNDEEGAILFCTPALSAKLANQENGVAGNIPTSKDIEVVRKAGRRGEDYYDRIRDVIDRILASSNEHEKRIAGLFNEIIVPGDEPIKEKRKRGKTPKPKLADAAQATAIASRPKRSSASAASVSSSEDEPIASLIKKRGRTRPSLAKATIDLSWKDGGALYPKRSSQVGDEFQATDIPAAGTYTQGAHSDLYELVWDPRASKSEMLATLLSTEVPPNKREQALVVLGLMGINNKGDFTPNMTEIVNGIQPVDGSDWSQEEKEKFDSEIFRLRKDMTALSKSIGKGLKSCLAYYLATYKKSDAYRLLKTVCTYERNEKVAANVHGVDACAICGDGGSLLICDGCEGEYHMGCLRPALRSIPEGHWECDKCVDKKLLKAREYILTHSNLYEPIREKKRKVEDISNDGNDTEDEYIAYGRVLRPSSPVMAEIKKFASQINEIFSGLKEATANPVKVEETTEIDNNV